LKPAGLHQATRSTSAFGELLARFTLEHTEMHRSPAANFVWDGLGSGISTAMKNALRRDGVLENELLQEISSLAQGEPWRRVAVGSGNLNWI
jgi:hypothetical protein